MRLHPDFFTRPIAHRALHGPGAPENSAEAVRRAVAAGYGIEIDLQLAADAQAMVFHDNTLDRMTAGAGPVRDLSAQDLSTVILEGGADGIPSLREVLHLVAGRVPLLIELKDQSGGQGGSDGALEGATAAALEGYEGPVAVMSFNPEQVAKMADLAPDIPRGITTSGFAPAHWPKMSPALAAYLRAVPDFDRVGASFISHDSRDLSGSRVAELKEKGVPIFTWTIRSPEEEAAARQIADNVTFEGYLPPVPAH